MKEIATTTNLTKGDIKTLSDAGIIPKGTPAAQVSVFAQICKEKGVSPFQKHIYLVKYGQTYQALMGIDGFRYIAGMTGAHAGTKEITFNDNMTLDQCLNAGLKSPRSAKCTVMKVVAGLMVEFTHTVAMKEFKGGGKWNTMPFQMLAKCAEAFALKKAFPEHLSGLHVPEEKAAFMKTSPATVEADAVEVDQAELLKTITDDVQQFQSSKELAENASEIISDAMSAGLDTEHINELKTFIKTLHKSLKDA